jgi:GTP-binding protein EngB required for normal cell division
MSPIRPGRAVVPAVSAEALREASAALRTAVRAGDAQLPAGPSSSAAAVVAKVHERTSLVGGHTVVALAGATGSGKSSLFNRLVGTQVATVGARRPTTSTPTAAVWGEEPAGELLDWLDVSSRHHVATGDRQATGGPVGSLDGLVLLDLPDFDSREGANREEAERVLALVDLFVWVTDPQKYADARLHDDYVAALSGHGAVMLVVLNQVDRLSPSEREQCVLDLGRLLARDGIEGATVLPVSATSGEGIDALVQRLANTVTGQNAARDRLAADVRSAAQRLSSAVADTEPDLKAHEQSELVDALSRSAGVSTVVDAVGRDYRMEAVAHTGWPFTRWVQAFRPRPLRRLRLDDKTVEVTDRDLRSVLGRSSIPPPSPAARAAVALATRNIAGRAGAGLPVPWADAVDAAVAPPGSDLTDALDRAVVATPLRGRDPAWWRVLGVLQVLLAIAALAGLVWYLALWGMGALAFPMPDPPLIGGLMPLPFALAVGGVLLGLLVAALGRILAGIGARRRSTSVERRLRSAVAEVADEYILAPVAEVLERHRTTRQALERARAL